MEAPAARSLVIPAVVLFVVLALLYTFSIGLRASRNASITGDEPFYLVTTQSLVQDGDLDLWNQYEYETYRSFFDHPDRLWRQAGPLPDGRVLAPHEPGLSVLVVPGFVLGGLVGAQVELLLLAALTFTLAFVLAALETGRMRIAWMAAAATALSAPAFVYSTEIYPDMPAALCLVSALLLLRLRPGAVRCVALIAVLSGMAWLGLKYVPLALIVAGVYAWRCDERERSAFIALGVASGAIYAWWHLATFGALTPYNSNLVYENASTTAVLESHIAFGDRFYRIWGLFIDRRFGVGRWAPLLLAILPALPLARRGIPGGGTVTALIGAQIVIATFVSITMMGWWFPGRMLIVVFPLFAVVLTAAAARAPRLVVAAGGLAAAYSVVVTALLVGAARSGAVTIAVDPFDMAAAPFRLAAPLFPQYTWWTRETIVLNALWVVGFVTASLAVGLWPYRANVRGLRARLVRRGDDAGRDRLEART